MSRRDARNSLRPQAAPARAQLRFWWDSGDDQLDLHLVTADGTIACAAQPVARDGTVRLPERAIIVGRPTRWYVRLATPGNEPVTGLAIRLEYTHGATRHEELLCEQHTVPAGKTDVVERRIEMLVGVDG